MSGRVYSLLLLLALLIGLGLTGVFVHAQATRDRVAIAAWPARVVALREQLAEAQATAEALQAATTDMERQRDAVIAREEQARDRAAVLRHELTTLTAERDALAAQLALARKWCP